MAGSQPSAQSHSVPYDAGIGPDLFIAFPQYTFVSSYDRVRDVDFRNLPLHIFYQDGTIFWTAKLKNGQYYRQYRPVGVDSVGLNSIHYFSSDEDAGQQYAIAFYTWISASGSSMRDEVAQVLELRNHHLRVIQQIDWGKAFTSKPSMSFNAKLKRLIIRVAHSLPGDSHGGVSAMDVFTFSWKKNVFVKIGVHTELSDYGISSGKKL